MRTDVKIGVATGLLLVIVLVAWQLVFNTNGDRGVATDGNSGGEQVAVGPGADSGAPSERPGAGLPRFGIVPSTPPPGKSAAPADPAPTVTPRIEPAPTVTPRVEPPVGPIRVAPEPMPTVTPIVEPPVVPIRPAPVTPGSPVVAIGPAAEETYEVQKGDSGFWAIAEKKYGEGKYYYLIAKANPNASSNSLRPGQKLVIPAKPVVEPTSPAAGSTPPGGVEISPSGQKLYVVQKGDSGFWGIAQKQYGDGKYYYLIANANPNVSSNNLQIGDKLVLPDKPASTTPVAGSPVTPARAGAPTPLAATPLTAGPGQKLYTITKEDTTGLWGIARKEYGNGAYWKILAQANPRLNSGELKVGQQLIVPELTEEARKAAGAIATEPRAPAAPVAKRTDVEDIGPTPRFR